MNKRIEELMREAGMTSYTEMTRGNEPVEFNMFNDFNAGKFAELIVKECANQCQEEYDARWILGHFGMEQ